MCRFLCIIYKLKLTFQKKMRLMKRYQFYTKSNVATIFITILSVYFTVDKNRLSFDQPDVSLFTDIIIRCHSKIHTKLCRFLPAFLLLMIQCFCFGKNEKLTCTLLFVQQDNVPCFNKDKSIFRQTCFFIFGLSFQF